MTRLMLVAAALTTLAACTTYKMWAESDADQDSGMIKFSYEYRSFENPQVDERGGLGMARERCQGWGYGDAHRKGEERECVDGGKSDCRKWRVTREYACEAKRK